MPRKLMVHLHPAKVADTKDVPPGKAACVLFAGEKVALFNVNGTVYAIANRCTHARASLSEGTVDPARCTVTCPWHEGVFSLEQTRRILEVGRGLGLRAKFHADEFTTLGGAELAAELGALSADHLLRARPDGVAAMAKAGVTATLLPGTAFFLGLPYAPAPSWTRRSLSIRLLPVPSPPAAMARLPDPRLLCPWIRPAPR